MPRLDEGHLSVRRSVRSSAFLAVIGSAWPRETWGEAKAPPLAVLMPQGPSTAIDALRPRESWRRPRYSFTQAPASRTR